MPSVDLEPALAILRRHYGYQRFRPAQERVVRAVLLGGDVLAVLPTGSGKSICFQVPALLGSGLTLVVSPLISLMQDQVAAAERRGIPAAALTGAVPAAERAAIVRAVRSGRLRLLYISPERLHSASFRSLISRAAVCRLAVDESHCISEWGHDFRPSYRKIAILRRLVGNPPCVALTATATPETRKEIAAALRLRSPRSVVVSVNRSNLHWSVRRVREPGHAVRLALTAVRRVSGPAILYLPTRERSVRMTEALLRRGIVAAPYHAGLPADRRIVIQQRFLAGALRAVCATTAFGMGIDHPSVRLVCNVGLPGSLEGYVQQAGRAGRDGKPSSCLLIAGREDAKIQLGLIRQTWPSARNLARVFDALPSGPVRLQALQRSLPRLSAAELRSALRLLEEFGCLRRVRGGEGERVTVVRAPAGARRLIDFAAPRRGVRRAKRRLEEIQRYAGSAACRRAAIADYFGEAVPRCTGCDRCDRISGRGRTSGGPSFPSSGIALH